MPATTLPARSEIAPEHTWNGPSLFASREAWSEAFHSLMSELPAIAAFQGTLSQGPDNLLTWLETSEAIQQRAGHVLVYAVMSQSVDTTDQDAASMVSQAYGGFGQLAAAAAFSEPELLALGLDTLRSWMAQEPGLAVYEHYFEDLHRRQAHVRSGEVEEVLGMASDPFAMVDNTAEMLMNADVVFKRAVASDGTPYELTQGTIDGLLASADREIRRTAWENYAEGYLAYKNTLSSNLVASMKRDVFYSRARRYSSSLEASLFQNNVSTEVFQNLIDTFKRNLPTWHRYWAVRRRALKVEKHAPYDIWAPLVTPAPQVSYEQAVDWICEGMQLLGEEYVGVLRQGCLQDRWVDIYPNKGKRQGAFSFGWRGTHPFILMSYDGDLGAMSTLAHELGHSMHSYLTWQHQPMAYSKYSLFVAEVASNFNQALVRAYLLEIHDDPAFQISVIEEAMNNLHRYLFIMPTLARFELEMHQRLERGAGVTADDMNALMADLFAEGYGSEMAFDRDKVGITWAQFSHLYANYYVYQYATGISAAHALAGRIVKGDQAAAQNYLKFLSAGSSVYPMDALKLAGVDMATSEPVDAAFAVLEDYVNRLDRLTQQL